MCDDCQDENNINTIPVGPVGPAGPIGLTGPAGPSPVLDGTSLSNVTVGLGPIDFTLTGDSGFVIGQRVSAVSSDLTKSMDGIVTAYSTVTDIITIDVSSITGVGTDNNWNIAVTGKQGITGIAGPIGSDGVAGTNGQNAYGIASAGVNTGVDLYTLTVDNSDWTTVGQMVYVQGAGYYEVTSKPTSLSLIVFDNGTVGNIPGNLVFGGSFKTISAAGVTGATGTNGTNGFNYETIDGNNIPAEAAAEYMFLMRNSDNTGYTFTSLSDLKALLALIP